VWRNSLDLARDYAFTGLGLGNFEMAYSSYVLLVHVRHTVHAHNLLLDLWLEQGPLGLLALGWIGALVVWTRGSALRWRQAALVSCGVILLHGLVDDAFYGYGGKAVWLMFIPLALLARSQENSLGNSLLVEAPNARPALKSSLFRNSLFQLAGVLGVIAVLMLAGRLVPGARAAMAANLGTVEQSRAELATYHWPESLYQDVVRRKVDLSTAIWDYQSALVLDPSNVTANRRLGQIELARGQYDEARRHLAAALAADPGQRATRQLLGECYAIAGETEAATTLWKTIDMSEGQLELRQWWYSDYLGEPELAARIMQAQTALGQ
jgi:tetratricopeptide (TPR) repeat protein